MIRDLSCPVGGNSTWNSPFTAAFKGRCKIPAYCELPAKFPHDKLLAFQLNWWNVLTHEQQQKPLLLSFPALTRAWHAHRQQSYLTIVSLNWNHWTCNALNPLRATLILHVAIHQIKFTKLHSRKRWTYALAWNPIFKRNKIIRRHQFTSQESPYWPVHSENILCCIYVLKTHDLVLIKKIIHITVNTQTKKKRYLQLNLKRSAEIHIREMFYR